MKEKHLMNQSNEVLTNNFPSIDDVDAFRPFCTFVNFGEQRQDYLPVKREEKSSKWGAFVASLTPFSSVTTRHNSNEFGSALAVPSVVSRMH